MGAVALTGLLAGCAADNPWGTESDSKGKIHLSLQTDGEVKSARPVFRSGEDGIQASDYLTLPETSDFEFQLEKKDGTYSGYFATIEELNASGQTFAAGAYTLTAYSGEKGKQGFESPYFEGSADFTILSDQTTDIDVTAVLTNSMIVLEYTQEFKDYMSAWDATIYTEGVTGGIPYSFTEERAAFVEPNKVSIALSFTTNEGKSTTVDVGGEFAPLAKTLYHVKIDVKGKETGDAALSITFDDNLKEEDVEIDLTDELFTTAAPTIETVGFTTGETVDMLEGTASDATLKMNVIAKAGLAKAFLTINSDKYTPSWGKEIDLCAATEAQQSLLTNAGISAVGFYKHPDKLAFLDLTEFGKSLPKGTHTIQLRVEDSKGAVSEAATVVLDSQDITIEVVDKYILFGSNEATMTFNYNGTEPERNISFKAINEAGTMDDVTIKKCELATGTRAFETKTYIFTLALKESTRSVITIEAYHKGTKIGSFDVPVTSPEYTVEADSYTGSVDLKITSDNATVEAAIVSKLQTRITDGRSFEVAERKTGSGIIILKGLTPNTPYIIETSLDGENWGHATTFTTEAELEIPNGNFSSKLPTINSGELQVGGKYYVPGSSWAQYTVKSSFSYDPPAQWATINDKTAYLNSTTKNTWYIVPSTWVDNNGMCVVRSVAYDHNGKTPDATGTSTYCDWTPTFTNSNKAAGELFLGSYSFNGSESRSNGIAFASRPSRITFDYDYSAIENGDAGLATIIITDQSGNSIFQKDITIEGAGKAEVDIKYNTTEKASKIYICFKSSNKSVAPVKVPSGKDLKESGNGNRTLAANTYHALATGSVLKIDNVTAHYDRFGSASGAPKRKTSTTAKK